MCALRSSRQEEQSYREPLAKVLQVHKRHGTVLTLLKVNKVPAPPIAPAALYLSKKPGQKVLELHKLLSQDRENLEFETYDVGSGPLPEKSHTYIFRVWWVPSTLKLVIDKNLRWVRQKYPDDKTHTHCPLTYETISAYQGHREGYRCGNIWITTNAYRRFVRDDVLRLRGIPGTSLKTGDPSRNL